MQPPSPSAGPSTCNRVPDASLPLAKSGPSLGSLASSVLAELTRLSAYVACQGCGGLLEAPALLGSCAHSVCATCAQRAASSRDPACPVRGCALPLAPRDLVPDTTTAHIVECVRLLEEQASGLADMVDNMPPATDEPDERPVDKEEDWLNESDSALDDQHGGDEITQPPQPMVTPLQRAAEDDVVVVCLSKLPSDIRKTCELICRQFGMEYVREFALDGPCPTLLVTLLDPSSARENNDSFQVHEISFSILFGMLRKLPIVSPDWLISCDKEGRIVDKGPFLASAAYATHSLPLFNNIVAYFEPNHDPRIKADIARLITDGGGTIVDTCHEIPPGELNSKMQIRIAPDSAIRPQSGEEDSVVLTPPPSDDPCKRVDFAWLSDCVQSGVCPPDNQHIFESCFSYSPS
jgi:hypothetical protein